MSFEQLVDDAEEKLDDEEALIFADLARRVLVQLLYSLLQNQYTNFLSNFSRQRIYTSSPTLVRIYYRELFKSLD